MSVRKTLESAIGGLVGEFKGAPYVFFTEADAVVRLHQLLIEEDRSLSRRVQTVDGHPVGLIHREYPTFFRFDDKNPTARVGPPARRGHYDTVILNPDFVAAHPVETVLNRSIKAERDRSILPFQAVVEFKLHTRGWSQGRAKGVIAELGKLHLSAKEAPLRYLVLLMRYRDTRRYRWEKYWPQVRDAADAREDIASVFAVHWTELDREPDVHRFGPWLK